MIDLPRLNRYICGILDCTTPDAAPYLGAALAEFSMGRDYHLMHMGGVHVLRPGDYLKRAEVTA